jgi:DNA-binding MarR family transcriptional regulator
MASSQSEEVLAILRAVHALGRRLRAERPQGGITVAGVTLLGTLRRLGVVSVVRLAEEERLQPQSLTRVLTSLEEDGLIVRLRGKVDRREMQVGITEAGLKLLKTELRIRRTWLESAMSASLTQEERGLLVAASGAMFKLALHHPESALTRAARTAHDAKAYAP